MLEDSYEFIGRLAHLVARPLLRAFYGRKMVRVRAVVVNQKDEILLVRSWFGHQKWSLPGGGIGRNERVENAAARELKEETGITVKSSEFKPLGQFINADSYAPFTINCQIAHVKNHPIKIKHLRRLEILDSAWFALDSLPVKRSATVDKALSHLSQKRVR